MFVLGPMGPMGPCMRATRAPHAFNVGFDIMLYTVLFGPPLFFHKVPEYEFGHETYRHGRYRHKTTG